MSPRFCCWCLVSVATLMAHGRANAQEPASARLTAMLRETIDTKEYQQPMTLKEFVGLVTERFAAQGKELPVKVNVRAFRDENPDELDPWDSQVQLERFPRQMTLGSALRIALEQMPKHQPTFLVRAGMIEITTQRAAQPDALLKQPVAAAFKSVVWHQAIDELAEDSGVSIAIDGKIKGLGDKTVSATFRNDIALQDAVRILAEMVELKVVHLPTGLFITTPEHAVKMHKELRELHEKSKASCVPKSSPGTTAPTG